MTAAADMTTAQLGRELELLDDELETLDRNIEAERGDHEDPDLLLELELREEAVLLERDAIRLELERRSDKVSPPMDPPTT